MNRGAPKGNQNAKKGKLASDAILTALRQEVDGADGKPTERLALIAEKLVVLACEGDMRAIREVFDRVEGKPTQAVEAALDVEGPGRFDIVLWGQQVPLRKM